MKNPEITLYFDVLGIEECLTTGSCTGGTCKDNKCVCLDGYSTDDLGNCVKEGKQACPSISGTEQKTLGRVTVACVEKFLK